MRIPLTKYGLPQVAVFPVAILTVMAAVTVLPAKPAIIAEALLLPALFWVLAFFRDPKRKIPQDIDILLSPADGVITDIDTVHEDTAVAAEALRISIFLNVFNVHINRIPCAVRIDSVTYKPGQYKNAMNPASGRLNESNDIAMTRLNEPGDKLLVRQISGAIARRIVCAAQPGQNFTGGQKFGMIKFGSRTELYLPASENTRCLVNVGDKVKAGLTILVRYQKC